MIHLRIAFYVDSRQLRREEIEASVVKNLCNARFDSVTLFCEQSGVPVATALVAGKCRVVPLTHRARYADLIQFQYQTEKGVVVIANGDVYFDDTISLVEHLTSKQVICLTRAESRNDGLYWPEAELAIATCHDAWIFRPPLNISGEFEFGRPGCDHRFAGECEKAGYTLLNPCRQIHAIHNHRSKLRTYPVPDSGPVDAAVDVGPPHASVHVTSEWTITEEEQHMSDAKRWSPDGLKLHGTGMWSTWQEKVKAALPYFCADCVYVGQGIAETDDDYRRVAEQLSHGMLYDRAGLGRDIEFGGRAVDTCLGRTTRMWLDSNVEANFMARHLNLAELSVLDIGAGYGRLAVVMREAVKDYTCVDTVPISSFICDYYVRRFAPSVRVVTLREYEADNAHYDVAVNIHSWNECSIDQVRAWMDDLARRSVRYLFTVPHNNAAHQPQWALYGGPSFRPELEARYKVIAEERLSFGCQHVLWERK
jgi:SAM-dependent methyltransferase